MTIRVSDYIMEQSVSIFSPTEISNEQLIAEMDVCCKLAMAYNKQLIIMEAVIDRNLSDFNPGSKNTGNMWDDAVKFGDKHTKDQLAPNQKPVNVNDPKEFTKFKKKQDETKKGFFASIWAYIQKFFEWISSKLKGTTTDVEKLGKFVLEKIQTKTPNEIYIFLRENNLNVEYYNPTKIAKWSKELSALVSAVYTEFDKAVKGMGKVADVEYFSSVMNDIVNKFTQGIQQIYAEFKQPSDQGLKPDVLLKQYLPGYVELLKTDKKSKNPEVANNISEICDKLTQMGRWIHHTIIPNSTDPKDTTVGGVTAEKGKEMYNNITGGFGSAGDKQLRPIMINMMRNVKDTQTVLNTIPHSWKCLKQFAGLEQSQDNK